MTKLKNGLTFLTFALYSSIASAAGPMDLLTGESASKIMRPIFGVMAVISFFKTVVEFGNDEPKGLLKMAFATAILFAIAINYDSLATYIKVSG